MLIVLQLYAAHLIGDFLLQPKWIAINKRRFGPLAVHAAIHFITACALVNIGLNRSVIIGIGALCLIHVTVDHAKSRMGSDGWIAFVIDQAIHLFSVAVIGAWLSGVPWPRANEYAIAFFTNRKTYLILTIYVGVVFGGGFFVQKVTQSFLVLIDDKLKASKPGLPNAGKYIGWVERVLVLTSILAGFNEAVGFLLAVKALTRYPEIKDDEKGHFAEYFLIGTLTSVGLALGGGLLFNVLKTWMAK